MQSKGRRGNDPSVSHGKNQSWRPHICARSDSLTVRKPALGTRLTAATCKVTTLVELPNCKLSPRANRSTEQALPHHQMHIKSAIPVRTLDLYRTNRIIASNFALYSGGAIAHKYAEENLILSKGDKGPVHSRKSFHIDQDRQSSPAAANKVSRKPARKRGEPSLFKYWRHQGLGVRAAAAVGCTSVDDIRDRGWHFFERRRNCGTRTLQELSDLVGVWPDPPRRYVAWVRRAPDEVLLEEMRLRGFAVVHGEVP